MTSRQLTPRIKDKHVHGQKLMNNTYFHPQIGPHFQRQSSTILTFLEIQSSALRFCQSIANVLQAEVTISLMKRAKHGVGYDAP